MPSTEGSDPRPSEGERLHALDGLRATAMFLGIVLHGFASFAIGLPVPWIVRDVRAGISFDLGMAVIHGFRMPLFFFIAGFFAHLLWRRLGTRGFIVHRARRIALPFVLGMATIIPASIAIFVWVGTPRPPPAQASIPTMHLWFLEMLLVLYAIAMLIAWAADRWNLQGAASRIDRAFDALFRSPGKAVVLAAITVIALWNGPGWGEVAHLGASVFFAPRAIAYFALFFGVGWWLHRRVHLLDTLRGPLAAQFIIAFLAFAVASAVLLVTYEFLVRYTGLGALLNGPRRRPLPVAASVTPTS